MPTELFLSHQGSHTKDIDWLVIFQYYLLGNVAAILYILHFQFNTIFLMVITFLFGVLMEELRVLAKNSYNTYNILNVIPMLAGAFVVGFVVLSIKRDLLAVLL